jgi:hypothetical protein
MEMTSTTGHRKAPDSGEFCFEIDDDGLMREVGIVHEKAS